VLGALGPDIVPQLLEAARHDDGTSRLGWTVRYGLERIGVDARPYLREMLDDPEPDIRGLALEVLGSLSVRADTALPKQFEGPLLRVLGDPVADVRAKVPQVLGRFGRGSGAVVPALVEALADDPHATVRYSTVIALRYIGTDLKEDDPELRTTIDALSKAVTADAHETVRIYAASALGAFGPKAKAAVPALRQAADDERERVRDKAQLALHQIGVTLQERTTAEARSAALVRQLASREWELQRAAIEELATLGPGNLDALMTAVRLDHEDRYWTAVAQVIGRWNGKVLPELGRIVREEEHYRVRRTVAMAIGWMPLGAMPDELRPLLRDENDWVRSTAVDSLARLSERAPGDAMAPMVDALVEAVHDKQLSVRERAFNPLERIGAGNPKIVLALVEILQEDPEPRARQQAVRSLGSIVRRLQSDDDDFSRILSALAEAVRQDGDESVRSYAISGLGNLGERARPVLSVLRVAEDDPLESIARAAREAVRKVTTVGPAPARRPHLPEPQEAPAPEPPPEPPAPEPAPEPAQ
jgi:HEAT repeat protein